MSDKPHNTSCLLFASVCCVFVVVVQASTSLFDIAHGLWSKRVYSMSFPIHKPFIALSTAPKVNDSIMEMFCFAEIDRYVIEYVKGWERMTHVRR